MVLSHWRIYTDTKRPEDAQYMAMKVQAQVVRDFTDIKIDDYHKGGHVVTFDISHEFEAWQAVVCDVIGCAQRMGRGWSISGFIDEELDLISNDLSIPGIKMVSCFCARPGTLNS